MRSLGRLMRLPRLWHRPRFTGLENFDPARPTLLVGNHALYGVLDPPHLVYEIYRRHGAYVRTLADRIHFRVPGWRDVLAAMGAVEGTRDACAGLMRAGEHLLVFPGGAREVAKRRGEAYRLIWRDRVGFVRIAIEHGYRIVPFASIGAEECFDILYDADDLARSRLATALGVPDLAGRLLRGGDLLFPLVRGVGPTVIPRPERFYFSLGRPIETKRLAGRANDEALLLAVRERVRASVEAQVSTLLAVRAKDPRRLPRLLPGA